MTRERYIVRNCPAITTGWNDKDYICNTHQMGCGHCQNCTNCVIKRVIEVCKKEAVINYPKKEKEFITVNGYQAILNIFDIKEINK